MAELDLIALLAPLLVRGCWTGLECECSGSARSCWCSQSTVTETNKKQVAFHSASPPLRRGTRDPLLLNAQVPRPLRSGGRFTLARVLIPFSPAKQPGSHRPAPLWLVAFHSFNFSTPSHSISILLADAEPKRKRRSWPDITSGHCVGRSHSDRISPRLWFRCRQLANISPLPRPKGRHNWIFTFPSVGSCQRLNGPHSLRGAFNPPAALIKPHQSNSAPRNATLL
jgi:hypothetical protein